MGSNRMCRAFAALGLLSGVALCASFAGCASPGEPTPPRPVIPEAIKNLSARQSGSSVLLSFTIPRRSTRNEPLEELPTLEIYRAALETGTTPDKKTMWRLAYTVPSARTETYLKGETIEFRDPLSPEDLSRAPGATLAYKVRTRALSRGSSADSNIVTARIFPAPGPPQDVRAAMTETSINLSWAPPEGAPPAGYRVYRAELEAGEEESSSPNTANLKSPLEMIGPVTGPEFSDTHFEFGQIYLYTVRATAQYGTDTVESEDSMPVVLAARDTFPPSPPTGLVGVLIPATNQEGANVELSWAISPEADVAGYHVYRSESSDTVGPRVTPEILPSPAFRDISVMPGKTYFYRVSAIDRAGNESTPSVALQIEIP